MMSFFNIIRLSLAMILVIQVWNSESTLTPKQLERNNALIRDLQRDVPFEEEFCDVGKRHQGRECFPNEKLILKENIEDTRSFNLKCSSVRISCESVRSSKYRPIDGICNNVKNPHWGMANNCLRRLLPYDYGDKIGLPRRSCKGGELPNPRNVSNIFHRELRSRTDPFTLQFMEWGQFVSHDMSLNDIFRTEESGRNFEINCCSSGPLESNECISCSVPPNDIFYPQHNVTCVNLVRTMPCPLCASGQRQHWNQNTGHHDVSTVYGSSNEIAMSLRRGKNGMLLVQNDSESGPLLPGTPRQELCVSPNTTVTCFKSGDRRTQQNLPLLTLHTLFVRHHNKMCIELKRLNPEWDDETCYQEARRIVVAQVQMITYGHYIRNILGPRIIAEDGLYILPNDLYTEYDRTLDASVLDEFTSVAQRYGHTLVPDEVKEIDPETGAVDTLKFRDAYYFPFDFYKGQFDKLVLGMTKDYQRRHDQFLGNDVRDYLFRRRDLNRPFGNDLAAISIARGRDHGIPGYTYYLKYCFDYSARNFYDLLRFMPCERVKLLEQLYESVHDIDLYPAGLAEYHIKGGLVGPTFACILRIQYKNTKFGDRYYFEHGDQPSSFTPDQLRAIRATRLEKIICDNTKIKEIQENVFLPTSETNPTVKCENIPEFDYKSFQDRAELNRNNWHQ